MIPRMFAVPDSSNIDAFGYDAAASRLFIRFKGPQRSVYAYENVTPEALGRLLSSTSMGADFTAQIRNNPAHPHTKIDEAKPPPDSSRIVMGPRVRPSPVRKRMEQEGATDGDGA